MQENNFIWKVLLCYQLWVLLKKKKQQDKPYLIFIIAKKDIGCQTCSLQQMCQLTCGTLTWATLLFLSRGPSLCLHSEITWELLKHLQTSGTTSKDNDSIGCFICSAAFGSLFTYLFLTYLHENFQPCTQWVQCLVQ